MFFTTVLVFICVFMCFKFSAVCNSCYFVPRVLTLSMSGLRSKLLWLDGFQKLHNIVTAKELLDLQEVMQDKELNLRTDVYEILLQDDFNH